MLGLKELFEEAYAVWRRKASDEEAKRGFPTWDYFMRLQNPVESLLIKLGFPDLKVKISVGKGRFAQVPWVGMRSDEITDNFEEGVFVVYVFAPNFGNVHLTIIQGVSTLTPKELEENALRLRKQIQMPRGFRNGAEGDLAKNAPFNSLPDKYKRGMLLSNFRFTPKSIPNSSKTTCNLRDV